MSHFNHWLNEHADMPKKQEDGTWVDLEDGLEYDPKADYGFVTPKKKKSNQISLDKAKESRKLAKFYGGKALTGSAKQKSWAESIRNDVLASTLLTEENKEKIVQLGGAANTAKFWINNKNKTPSAFNAETILAEDRKLSELYEKHYDTLTRTASSYDRELARKEIYGALSSLTINVTLEFPNCDFFDVFGVLKSGMKFRC